MMDWTECELSQYEFCHVGGVSYWAGNDGMPEEPVFGAMIVFGDNTELYRGTDINSAKQACQAHLEGLNK